MSGKRGSGGGGFNMAALRAKKQKLDSTVQVVQAASSATGRGPSNPYLSHPVQPEKALQTFLAQVRTAAREYLPKDLQKDGQPITTPFCEVEARLGILKVPNASPARRVCSTGAKHVQGKTVKAFECSRQKPKCSMESGVSRSHFSRWTAAGLSEAGSPLAKSLGCHSTDNAAVKRDLVEVEYTETVYSGGYANDARVCFPGLHSCAADNSMNGVMESKEKLAVMDLAVPASPYDLRLSLASEKIMNPTVGQQPPVGWTSQRVKRRRSYSRRDKSIAWQIDVTEVTTSYVDPSKHATIDYEIEMELREAVLLQLINEEDPAKLNSMTASLGQQLWWILRQINPLVDALDAEESLQDHPNTKAVTMALAQCGALRKFMDSGCSVYDSPVGKDQPPSPLLANAKFPGCMPVNFSRHNIDEIQRSPDNDYYLSEKTDGVRHFLVFTGDTAVLVDRAMRGKQPVPIGNANKESDPFASILGLIKPGTVLDGEVVMNRRPRGKPRPVFIVFDVMAISVTEPVLHLPFEQRLRHLRRASFRTPTAAKDMFDPAAIADESIALPLVRKNFVKRTDLDDLLSHVVEEQGMRCYRNGDLHNHLTDGIIFQPNRPYVCGTDVNLLKWKYLDTVTIDVELLALRPQDDDEILRTGVSGSEDTSVDMTRYILLPKSERMRLEADRFETGGRISEVGFDPETGEWYYLTMRTDKIAPNHINTVLGTLLELAESLTADELRYRMSVPAGVRDTYRKDMRRMLTQLLDHQRKQLKGPTRHPPAR
jgi:mRNA guanylyltransferase